MVESKPSETARKRAHQAQQKLGEEVIELSREELDRLALDERLLDAVLEAQNIRSNSALRRQRQLIGKLMRQIDPEPIRAGLAAIRSADLAGKRLFAKAEKWRDRIADEGRPAIDAFRAETGGRGDNLEAVLAELSRSHSHKALRAARRKLFRAVNDALLATATDDRLSR